MISSRCSVRCPLLLLPLPLPSAVDDDHKQSTGAAANGSSPYSQPQLVLMRVLSECGFDLQTAMERADQTRSSTLILRQSAARSRPQRSERTRRERKGDGWRPAEGAMRLLGLQQSAGRRASGDQPDGCGRRCACPTQPQRCPCLSCCCFPSSLAACCSQMSPAAFSGSWNADCERPTER